MSQVPPASSQVAAVNGPSMGLIITAVLGIVLQLLNILGQIFGFSANLLGGQDVEAMIGGGLSITSGVIGLLVAGLILYGAAEMKKLQSYGLSIAVSILAMLPCISPCCILGLPIGIWALVTLSRPEVKAAFRR